MFISQQKDKHLLYHHTRNSTYPGLSFWSNQKLTCFLEIFQCVSLSKVLFLRRTAEAGGVGTYLAQCGFCGGGGGGHFSPCVAFLPPPPPPQINSWLSARFLEDPDLAEKRYLWHK